MSKLALMDLPQSVSHAQPSKKKYSHSKLPYYAIVLGQSFFLVANVLVPSFQAIL